MKQRKSERIDIIILLCVLLVFSCGISILYGMATTVHVVSHVDDKDIFRDLQSLDESGAVHKMAQFIATRPFDQQLRVLHHILISKTSALNMEEKAELAIELLSRRKDVAEQTSLLDTLNRDLKSLKIPLIYIAADKKLLGAIPMIVSYYAGNTREQQNQIYQALVHAIMQNNLKNFSAIITTLGTISGTMATQLLWDVIQKGKDAQFILILVAQKADIENAKAGKTPLIAAVDANNVEMVQLLLDKGAQVNRFVDPVVGTPLQRALREKRSTIELLLRERGARE